MMDAVLGHEVFHLYHAGQAVDQPGVPLYGSSGWNYSVQVRTSPAHYAYAQDDREPRNIASELPRSP